jgi:hypothetical protein
MGNGCGSWPLFECTGHLRCLGLDAKKILNSKGMKTKDVSVILN